MMNEAQDLFSLLRQSTDVDPQAIDAIRQTIAEGKDRELCRINVPAFASKHGLDEERTISAFLHAARVGIGFGGQILDTLPVEDTDEPVDVIVTDGEVIRVEDRA